MVAVVRGLFFYIVTMASNIEWTRLMYIQEKGSALPFGITIYPHTFHYDATGTMSYVYNEVTGAITPQTMYRGTVPVTRLPKSLRNSQKIERGVVYDAKGHDNHGIHLGAHCGDGTAFFFPYDTFTTATPPQTHTTKGDLPLRTQTEMVAVLVHAHDNGGWSTFRLWVKHIRFQPKGHTIQSIHNNPKNHLLIPYLRQAERKPDGRWWRAKMMANFAERGVIRSYLRYCAQHAYNELQSDENHDGHSIEASLVSMITEEDEH